MGKKLVQWGMIGCGSVTEKKSGPAFSRVKGSKLAAVGSRNPKKAEDYARKYGVTRWHKDPLEVIGNPDVDIVYIATPPGSHREYALAAIGAGKPVYIEKPMARTYRECREINDAADWEGVPVFVAYYRRSLEYFRRVKKIVEEGRIGRPLQVNIQQHFPPRPEDFDWENPPWRVIPEISGGGYFYDMGCHALDILFYIFGEPLAASGTSSNLGGIYDADDTVSALLTLPGDLPVTGSWSFFTPEPFRKDRVEVTGEQGILEFSIFSFDPIRLLLPEEEENFTLPPPEYIQMPLIASIVDEMNGKGICPSTGRSGAVTSRIMELISGKEPAA